MNRGLYSILYFINQVVKASQQLSSEVSLRQRINQQKKNSNFSKIRHDDYVVVKDTCFEGFTGIAVPIRDYTGEVVSSIAVIGPNNRLTEAVYSLVIQEMKAAAEDISELLGYYGEH